MPPYFAVVIVWSFAYAEYRRYFISSSVFGDNLSHLLRIWS
jgi:peptidoglycan/LPS O-acetylase OafA/YrhL